MIYVLGNRRKEPNCTRFCVYLSCFAYIACYSMEAEGPRSAQVSFVGGVIRKNALALGPSLSHLGNLRRSPGCGGSVHWTYHIVMGIRPSVDEMLVYRALGATRSDGNCAALA